MKILVIAPSWVGDLMMSHTLYRCLKQVHPQVSIDVMAPDWCRPLLLKMPEVTHALPVPIGHGQLMLRQRRLLGHRLRMTHYQQAIVLPNSFKSALIPFFADIPRRTGWRGEMRYGLINDLRILDQQQYPLIVQRYAALAYDADHDTAALSPSLPWPQLVVTAEEKRQTATGFLPPQHQPLIGLCPGAAFGPAKCWPPYHYAALARQLIDQGYWVALFGSGDDQLICELIQQKLAPTLQTHCLNYAGRTTLNQVIALLACCQAVVSNDSGLMHIAAALGKPVVALYGPTPPTLAPPLTQQFCTLPVNPLPHPTARRSAARQEYHPNLVNLQPAQVFTALTSLLAMRMTTGNP